MAMLSQISLVIALSATMSATLFLDNSGPMIVSTRVDWDSKPQPRGVTCAAHKTDVVAKELRRKKTKDDKKYSTLILKMCDGSKHRAVLKHQSSILGAAAELDEYTGLDHRAKVETGTLEQEDDCTMSGHLVSDPASQVTLTGCQGEEDGQVLTIVTDKHTFKSSSYRFSGDHVEMANGLFHDTIVTREDRPNGANGGEGGAARQHRDKDRQDVILPEVGPKQEPNTSKGAIVDDRVLNYYKGTDYQPLGLKHMTNRMLKQLHQMTKDHWEDQHELNKDSLRKILSSPQDTILVHEHSVKRLPHGKAKKIYEHHTIEVCVITDPYLWNWIQTNFGLASDEEVTQKIFRTVHRTLVESETFLRHSSISSHGGFKIKLNGIRVLKDWGSLSKMSKRENLQDVLFDLGDYLQVVNHRWDGHKQSYDLVVLFTGNMDFEDGDGYAYIGGVCQQDAPISIKMRFDKNRLNLNMGRLLAHEIGHALGANHDDDFPPCQGQDYLMNSVVSNSMNTWSKCSARDIDKTVSKQTKDSFCFHI